LVLPEQQPVFETMAILLALDERHPQAALLPASGTAERATAVQWLAFLATQAYGSALRYWYPQRHTSDPAEAAIAAVKRQSAIDMRRDLGLYCAAMQGKFLLGDRLTITDVYAAMIGDWEEPAFTDARLAALREAVLGVDTVRAAWESHQFSR
jgi:glutathione S-transferase